ncbi:MAG: hypothetical protein KOO63_12525 [Bacteroidales bacterium]|nr:hypothetical protein [Candidatus Latescibacterota bacterium]
MKKIVIILVAGATLCASIYGSWYYFVETLYLSEIIGQTENPMANIMINLLDFDTELTRYDVHQLKSKAEYWNNRIDEVNSIQDPELWAKEQEKLFAEMMDDPSMKKIIDKVIGFGTEAVMLVLESIRIF